MADPQSSSIFDEDRLRRLIELMKEHDLSELELRAAEQHIRLSRGASEVPVTAFSPPQVSAPVSSPAIAPQPTQATSAEDSDGENIKVIRSPMVGTFYNKPNPNAEPYVRVGQHVEQETTVCIIEAMKLFNEVGAEVSGKIVKVLVEDAQPVEYDQVLFLVDPKG